MTVRRPRPTTAEWLLALGLGVTGLGEVWVPFVSRQGSGSTLSATVAIVIVSMLLLWCRRRPVLPLVALPLVWAGTALASPTYVLFYGQFLPLIVTVFMAARHGSGRVPFLSAGVAAGTLVVADVFVPQMRGAGELVFHWTVTTLVWVTGYSLSRWQRRAHESTRRAIEAEVNAARQAMEAVVEERTRISRELHDIVAHSISSIVVQAGAAEQAEDDREFVGSALASIRSTGNEALTEMRRLVGLLREDEWAPRQPQPGLQALPALVAQASHAGLRTELTVAGPERCLPAGLDLAIYRIVQESLTNVRRHSGATTCHVRLDYRPDEVRVEVLDNGRARSDGPDATAVTDTAVDGRRPRGHGILGMRERAGLYGGQCEAGPHPGGGFIVRASLPVAG
jgi:signal transduction histidine kinase